jgi:myo-inositol-1(or 4)-monophosphatase
VTNQQHARGDSDLSVAIAAATAGAEVLRAMYGTELEHTSKSATDFATAADIAAERAILKVIRSARPDDGFVGEELGESASSRSLRRWMVDPLCGTLNFSAGTSHYCVNVALRVAGTTTVAAVSHPPTGETYWADGDRFGTIGQGSPRTVSHSAIVDINADGPLDRPFVGAQLAADPEFRARFSPRVESTTLALAWVATGHRLGYVTDGDHRDSVHFTAPLALCRAAGCVISDFDGRPVHTGPGIVAAADSTTHAALLRMIAPHRRSD